MASFNKFQQFVEDVALGVHTAALNADTDTLKVYLSNATPDAALDNVKADLAEITNENGYTAPVDVLNAASIVTGTITVVGTDVVITASGGTVGPFRYAVLYNDTPASPLDPLIGWWDYGSAITLQAGESFTVDFGASLFTIA
jgi:hypothetical protein